MNSHRNVSCYELMLSQVTSYISEVKGLSYISFICWKIHICSFMCEQFFTRVSELKLILTLIEKRNRLRNKGEGLHV